MNYSDIAAILAIAALVFCSAFFSAAETAYTSLSRIRLKAKADSGSKRAALALDLVEQYDRLLTAILIGNNVINIVVTTLSTALFLHWMGAYGPTVSTLVLTLVLLIFGEVSPKSLAKDYPERCAMFAAPVMRLLMVLFTPLSQLFSQWKHLLSLLFHGREEAGITEKELVTMVDQAENEGGLARHEGELIRSAIEFADMEVEDILTPRVDITAVEDTNSMDEIANAFAESGFSRLPVYHGDIDDIVGVIHEKDFYAARCLGWADPAPLISPILCTTANTKIFDLLRSLQREKAHMAVVVDEYGGTEGLCTLEDIVEELVGEIWDEHDEIMEAFQKQPDGSYLISCGAALTDLYDRFDLTGRCEASTVSGWVLEQIGRVPQEGDRFQADGLNVVVTQMDHRRVLKIQVSVLPKDAGDEG